MAVEAPEPPKAQEPLQRNDPQSDEGCVEARDIVPLRGEEDVAVRVIEPELGDVQLLVEEVHHEVERAEARAEMT